MNASLRLGVVGLGRRWQRYQSAVAALGKAVRVQAAFDVKWSRAAEEAARSRCPVAAGVVELIERDDIDAVLLTSGGWMGLWPLERAALAGKPIFCAVSPTVDENRVDTSRATARVIFDPWPALNLLRLAFEDRVRATIGPVLRLQATWTGRLSASGDVLGTRAALALLDTVGLLMGATAQAITASSAPNRLDSVNLTLEFSKGRVANLLFAEASSERYTRCRLDIDSPRGTASLSLPGRLTWLDAEGRFAYRPPCGVAELASLEGFLSAIEEDSFTDGDRLFRSLEWLRAARASRRDGRRVELDVKHP